MSPARQSQATELPMLTEVLHNKEHYSGNSDERQSRIAECKRCLPGVAISDDGAVLLDIEHDRLLKLNPIASRFWKALAEGKTEEQIVKEVTAEHGADPNQVLDDLRGFQARVLELGLQVSGPIKPTPQSPEAPRTLPTFPWYASKHSGRRAARHRFWTASALAGLIVFDCVLSLFPMKSLCGLVRWWPVRRRPGLDEAALPERICLAVENACVWYPRKTLCLQRSAVTTCLLRFAGLRAELVIGAQAMPLQAHAWVEFKGSVINDHRGVTRVYRVLARY